MQQLLGLAGMELNFCIAVSMIFFDQNTAVNSPII